MPLTLSRSAPTCVVSLPTLVVAGRPDLGRRVVALLEQLGIVDVDVAPDYVEAHQRATERDYSAVVLAGRPARSFGFRRFCSGFGGAVGEPPGVVHITDGPAEDLPCNVLKPFRLEPDFEREDLRKAVWTAVESAGRRCKSAGLCGLPSCKLAVRAGTSH